MNKNFESNVKFENYAWSGIRLVSIDKKYEISGHLGMCAIELTTFNKNAGTGTEEFFIDTIQVSTLLKRFPSLKDFMPFIFGELDYVKLNKQVKELSLQVKKLENEKIFQKGDKNDN